MTTRQESFSSAGAAIAGLTETLIDTSEHGQVYAISRDGDTYVRLSARARIAYQLVQRGASAEEMADELGRELGRTVRYDEAEAFCARVSAKCEQLFERGKKRDHAFLFKLPLLSAEVISAICRPLTPAFAIVPAGCLVLLCAIGLPLGWSGGRIGANGDWRTGLLAYALFLISALIHEFGHASACLRFGTGPRAIGFTVYAMFPAFYTDVTDAWLLKRAQRVIVDLGGSYFQLAVGGLYGILYAVTTVKAFHWAILMILTASVFNLNPIFKFDGYWVVADALGVTNLSARGRHIVRGVLSGDRSSLSSWPRSVTVFLLLYGIVSMCAWTAFTFFVIRGLWSRALFLQSGTIGLLLRDGIRIHWALVPPVLFTVAVSALSLAFLLRTLWRGVASLRRTFSSKADLS